MVLACRQGIPGLLVPSLLVPDPDSLVEGRVRRYGRFVTRPASVNPLDEFTGLARTLRWLRLKEWVGFTLLHPDWYSSLIIQDAHYLASSEVYAYDRRTGALHQHAGGGRAARWRCRPG